MRLLSWLRPILISRSANKSIKLGRPVYPELFGSRSIQISRNRRAEHISILGKTGSGKSYLLRYLCEQDIKAGRGFVFFDLHGDTTPWLLGTIAREERKIGVALDYKTIVVDPTRSGSAVGLNVLQARDEFSRFAAVQGVVDILRQRWRLDAFGGRTEELLRNSLLVLSENNLTIVDLPAFLANRVFRALCLSRATDSEAKTYFVSRFENLSDAMQNSFREAVLNKVTVFSADPHFRHILGQRRSTVDFSTALDRGYFVIINLAKGQLGPETPLVASLIFSHLKHAIFKRERSDLVCLYCDELQNIVAIEGTDLDLILAEARKFGVGVVTANQFLEQYPPAMRAAVLALGTQVFFRSSASDAIRIAHLHGGGQKLAFQCESLACGMFLVTKSEGGLQLGWVPRLKRPAVDYADLQRRAELRWALQRQAIESDIRDRQAEALARFEWD